MKHTLNVQLQTLKLMNKTNIDDNITGKNYNMLIFG